MDSITRYMEVEMFQFLFQSMEAAMKDKASAASPIPVSIEVCIERSYLSIFKDFCTEKTFSLMLVHDFANVTTYPISE